MMSNTEMLSAFRAFLDKEFSSENLLFLEAAQAFRMRFSRAVSSPERVQDAGAAPAIADDSSSFFVWLRLPISSASSAARSGAAEAESACAASSASSLDDESIASDGLALFRQFVSRHADQQINLPSELVTPLCVALSIDPHTHEPIAAATVAPRHAADSLAAQPGKSATAAPSIVAPSPAAAASLLGEQKSNHLQLLAAQQRVSAPAKSTRRASYSGPLPFISGSSRGHGMDAMPASAAAMGAALAVSSASATDLPESRLAPPDSTSDLHFAAAASALPALAAPSASASSHVAKSESVARNESGSAAILIHAHMFVAAEQNIFRLLETDSFQRFRVHWSATRATRADATAAVAAAAPRPELKKRASLFST